MGFEGESLEPHTGGNFGGVFATQVVLDQAVLSMTYKPIKHAIFSYLT